MIRFPIEIHYNIVSWNRAQEVDPDTYAYIKWLGNAKEEHDRYPDYGEPDRIIHYIGPSQCMCKADMEELHRQEKYW